jgi:hypothetical protein
MAQQTSVEWLFETMAKTPMTDWYNVLEQAKEMHKQEITKTAIKCHFEGVRQSAKNSKEYIHYGEQYYNETFNQ